MNSGDVTSTAAQRMLHARYGMRAGPRMADVITLTGRVMRDRVRRPLGRRRAAPEFELLVVTDELADLAACLSDDRRGVRW